MNTLLRHTMAPVALLALALPVLTGCRQDSVRGVEDPDHTVRSTVLGLRATSSLPTGGVRAVTEEQTDVAPAQDTGEGKITYMQVSLPQLNFLQKTNPTKGSNDGEYTGLFQIPLLQSVTTPYAVLIGSQDLGLTTTDFTPDKTVGSDRFLDLIHADGFVQTSKSSEGSTTITPGVTEPSPQNGNFVSSVKVERVVGKLQIAQKDGLSLTLPSVGTFSSLTYSMAGSAKETYLFRDHAGSRTLDETGDMAIYKGFKSFVDDKTVPTDWDSKEEHPFLRRVSDKEGTDYVLGGYYRNPKAVTTATAKATSINGGFYFYENSMYGGTKKVADKKGEIKYNRIAYAKVYTKLTPTHAYTTKYVSGSYERELVKPEEFAEEHSYMMEIPAEVYSKIWNLPQYKGKFVIYNIGGGQKEYNLKVTEKPGTFYEGIDDGLLYLRLRDAVLMGNKSVRKYDEGRMVYLLPLNRQLDPNKKFVNYCDTRRNNIYDITIDGIDAIGHNYDPVDPDDPNVPKPEDNPFEPPTDPQIPVEEPDYLMRITAKVIKWNLVEKHYALWE